MEKKHRAQLDERVERMLLGWLLEQANARPTAALVPKMERMRRRRRERLGL